MNLNVHGNLSLKSSMNDFIECYSKYDCLFLSETWCNNLNVPNLKGFSKPFFKNRKRKKAAKRDSGGLCVYFREGVKEGVEEIFWDFEDGMLFRLDKGFFGWEKDAFLMCVYMRSNLSTRENINDGLGCYDRIAEKMTEIPEGSMFYAMGDFNARVGEREECFIDNVELENFGSEEFFMYSNTWIESSYLPTHTR